MTGKDYNDTLLAMKPLTLFLFLSLSLAGFGQIKIDSGDTLPTYRYSGNDTVGLSCQPIYDTVAVWLEYADTTKIISYNMTVKGYEVVKLVDLNPPVWISDCVMKTTDWVHVAYLDHFKKPLNRLVWGSKRREK
jgi:hypothetical protein